MFSTGACGVAVGLKVKGEFSNPNPDPNPKPNVLSRGAHVAKQGAGASGEQ